MADDLDPRTTYLTRVATGLRLSDSLDREVVEELAGHIEDSVHALEGEGLDPSMARREALARLGDPDELASGLRRAHQTRRRLLAAAGYGVVAALNGAFWGYLFAVAVSILCVLCGVAIISAILRVTGDSVSTFGAATSALAIPTLWFTSALAGRRACAAVAARSFRDRSAVAPGIALVGGAAIGFVTLFWWRGTLDPVLVVALLGTPILFALGALTPIGGRARPGRVHWTGRAFLVALAVGTAAVVVVGLLTMHVHVSFESQVDTAAIGPPWPGTERVDAMDTSGDTVASGLDAPRVLIVEPLDALAGLDDLRLEAWPLSGEAGGLDPGASAPTATGPMVRTDPGVYEGDVALEPSRQTAWYAVVTTGVGRDGVRYVLLTDFPIASPPWVGSVWEWLTGR